MFAKKSAALFALLLMSLFALVNKASALSCSVNSDSWNNGYVLNVTVTNDGNASISNWEIILDFNQAPAVSNSWSTSLSTSGNSVTASNVSYNGNLGVGQSTNFGFQGSHNGNFQTPSCGTGGTPPPTATPPPTDTPPPTMTPTPTPIPPPTMTPTPTPTPTPTMTPTPTPTPDSDRYRLIWSSDFPSPVPPVERSDPDDVQTMVRLLLYSNELDIEGFIASAGTYSFVANKNNLYTMWDRYAQVYNNLAGHDSAYPSPDYLRSITYEGMGNEGPISIQWGCSNNSQSPSDIIGEGRDSEGSNAIIAAADKPDPRPLWIGVAGGPREVAQAIWRVRNDRNAAEAAAFISKLRVFLIFCQDASHDYIMDVPGLFVIESRSTYSSFFCGGGGNCNSNWVDNNIRRGHGPLGEWYPPEGCCIQGVQEGDTPAFLHLISGNRGINNPENPAEAGWGGRYRNGGDNKWLDTGGGGDSIRSWRDNYQDEFAERADRMVD